MVYTEKEIISLAAKAGVNANSIPDIHQGMIDDGLVEKAKISGSNYFWSFKAKKDRMAQIQHEKTLKAIEELKPKVAEAEVRLSDAKRGREEDDEKSKNDNEDSKEETTPTGGRAKKLARLTELGKQKVALEAQLEKLKENDPAALADLEKELRLVTQVRTIWFVFRGIFCGWVACFLFVSNSNDNKIFEFSFLLLFCFCYDDAEGCSSLDRQHI